MNLIDKLIALAKRREMEGIYTDQIICLESVAALERMEGELINARLDRTKAQINYQSTQLAFNKSEETITALRAELHKYKAKYEAAEETLRESDKLAAEAQAEIARLRAALEKIIESDLYPSDREQIEPIARAALGGEEEGREEEK